LGKAADRLWSSSSLKRWRARPKEDSLGVFSAARYTLHLKSFKAIVFGTRDSRMPGLDRHLLLI
jgi:hypothetical protein